MQSITPYMGRELMQAEQGSEETMQVDWLFLTPPILTILCGFGLMVVAYLSDHKYQRLNQSFKEWTHDSTLLFTNKYSDGRNPLQIAAEVNHLALVTHLLNHGNPQNYQRDRCKNTALHYAAAFSQLKIVELIANHEGLTTLPQNENHQTPLHIAAYRAKDPTEREVFTYLLGHCSKEDQLIQDIAGDTFLHVLCRIEKPALCGKRYIVAGQGDFTAFISTFKEQLNPGIFSVENHEGICLNDLGISAFSV
jgi:hypothetical protein